MFHLALFEPEIPPNTGNIIRLCANTGTQLHLIHPLGFSLKDSKLRRAGLDYQEWSRVQEHTNFTAFSQWIRSGRIFAFTTKASHFYHQITYQEGDTLLFGPETRGLPEHVIAQILPQHRLRIPMTVPTRSLNLSNAVAIAVYEAWRQMGFRGAK
jgi:tRNA (cytidine(34)-2'-O)-methyltransferase